LANRTMAIFAIWTTATLVLMATRSTERQGKLVQRRTRELRESEKSLRLITDNIPALISYIDNEYRYRFLNKRYEEWFCRPIKEMIDRRCRLSSVRCRTRSLHHAQRVGHWNRYPN
jgi:PAS domain-containing protein